MPELYVPGTGDPALVLTRCRATDSRNGARQCRHPATSAPDAAGRRFCGWHSQAHRTAMAARQRAKDAAGPARRDAARRAAEAAARRERFATEAERLFRTRRRADGTVSPAELDAALALLAAPSDARRDRPPPGSPGAARAKRNA